MEFVRGGLGLNMWDVPESELLQLLGGDIYNMAGVVAFLKYLLGIFIPKFGEMDSNFDLRYIFPRGW